MIITKELVISLYDYTKKDIENKFDYLDEITKKLNISTEEFITQIEEIVSQNLYLEKKEKDLDVSESVLDTLFKLFLEHYTLSNELKRHFILSEYIEEDMSKIKTIELKNYYISAASDQLRLYIKNELPQEDSFLLPAKNRIYINLYEMDVNFAQPENYINDMLEISDNLLIVLFINLIFLFNIENNKFTMIKLLREKYKLVKCCKYDKRKIMIGNEKNILIYEILDNFVLQKIAIIELGIKYRKNYYFFNKIIMVNTYESILLFSIDKKFQLTKIKKDYIIPKYTRIKVCYMKKINMFVLLKNTLGKHSLILTDFENIYDEVMAPLYACNIQEYSKTDEFLLLFLEHFGKYKIENNKIKLIFLVKIKCNNNFKDFIHIKQISDDKYFITGMSGYLIYRYDKNDEKDLIDEES